MPVHPAIRIALPLAVVLASACGGDEPAPFQLRIHATDVELAAAEEVQIALLPPSLARTFRMQPDGVFEDGTVTTRVTAAGEFLIRVQKAYLATSAEPREGGFSFAVPLAGSPQEAALDRDPSIEATVIDPDGERIAIGRRLLDWPLEAGATTVVTVSCDRPTHASRCSNGDPSSSLDGGT